VAAYRLWVRGGGRQRAELVDETAAIPVVKEGAAVKENSIRS